MAFPRGVGTSTEYLTPLEMREVNERASREVGIGLFADGISDLRGSQEQALAKIHTNDAKRKRDHAGKKKKNAVSSNAEVEEEGMDDDVRKRKKSKKSTASVKDNAEAKIATVKGLTFKRLAVGMTVVGVVKEINDLDVAVSLPNLLTGHLAITEISKEITKLVERIAAVGESDENVSEADGEIEVPTNAATEPETGLPSLHHLFVIGLPVLCVIIGLETSEGKDGRQKRKIELSVRPELLNYGMRSEDITEGMLLSASVSAQEDHGYIISFGIPGISGFLHKSKAASFVKTVNEGRLLSVGQTLSCCVFGVDESRRNVTVSIDRDAIAQAKISSDAIIPFEALKAGQVIPARVTSLTETGVVVKVMGLFNGTIDRSHLGAEYSENIENHFKVGKKILARVLHVDPQHKRIGLTLNSDLISWNLIRRLADIGQIFEDATVTFVDEEVGLILDVGNGLFGFVHISRVSDSHISRISKDGKFAIGTKHRARVLDFELCDGLLQLTMQPSVLDTQFLRKEDVKPGLLVKANILRIEPFGLLVSISETITGLVPKTQLAETAISNPERLYKVGASIKCRVLNVDAATRRITLTLKKNLVNSKLEPIVNYASSNVGLEAHGSILAVKNFGCVVGFYNDVRAIAPISELSERFVSNPSELFNVGQVVKCRIVSCDPEKLRMTVSFKLYSPATADSIGKVAVGDVVEGRILSMLPEAALIELLPSLARGVLHKSHVADHMEFVEPLFSSLKEGSKIPSLVVLQKDDKKSQASVSIKPLLLQLALDLKHGKTSLDVGMPVFGYVKSVTDSKVFVGMVNGRTGVVKINDIADSFVTNPSEFAKPGQTVRVVINGVDESHDRLLLSMKQSLLSRFTRSSQSDPSYLLSYFSEADKTHFHAFGKESAAARAWGHRFSVGSVQTGTVSQRTPFGFVIKMDDGETSGFATTEMCDSGSVKEGAKLHWRVLDADFSRKIVDLKLVTAKAKENAVTGIEAKKLRDAVTNGETVDAVVEIIKSEYLIVAMQAYPNCVAFLPARSYNSSENTVSKYKVGQKLKVVISRGPQGKEKSTKSFDGFLSQRTLLSLRSAETLSSVATDRRMIATPVDPSVTCLEDLTLGRLITVRVKSVNSNQMNVSVGANLSGRVHVTNLVDSIKEIKDKKNPFKSFASDQFISCKVLGFHENSKNHRFLPFSHRNPVSATTVDLTLKPSDLTLPDGALKHPSSSRYSTLSSIQPGDSHLGFISRVTDDALWISLTPTLLGRATILNCSDNLEKLRPLSGAFIPGEAVMCRVLSKNEEKSELNLTLRSSIPTWETLQPKQVVIGRVSKVNSGVGLLVEVSDKLFGRLSLADLRMDESREDPTSSYTLGDLIECHVIAVDAAAKKLTLTTRSADSNFAANQLAKGFVKSIGEGGVFVDIGRAVVGRVQIKELSDDFVKDWKSLYTIGQAVTARILSFDETSRRAELSLKASLVDPSTAKKKSASEVAFSSLKKGMKVSGVVKAVESYGVFIRIEDSKLSGLCHKSELADKPVVNVESLYSVGDHVKAIILSVDSDKRRISFGLKASYFSADDVNGGLDEDTSDMEADSVAENKLVLAPTEESDNEDDSDASDDGDDHDMADAVDTPNTDMDIDGSGDDEMDDAPVLKNFSDQGALEIRGSGWEDEEEDDVPESDDDGPSTTQDSLKKSRKAKQKERAEAEERIRAEEESLLSGKAPDSADSFDRLLLGSPNSSFLWIKYMAFCLQGSNVQRAREIAERALSTISQREAQERMNVWVALLNLENTYGDVDSRMKAFEKAVVYNEPKKMYLQMAHIYERSGKFEDLDKLFAVMVKKFKESCKVWVAYGLSLLKRGQVEDSRQVLQRALKSLAKRKHLKIICKFAQMEFKFGEPERGRTLFERIISLHPNRLDMWSIYIDKEIGCDDNIATTRRLFERVLTLKLSSKKMKFLFKKYLDFEKSKGTPDGVKHVKEAAMQYVQSLQ